MVVIAMKRLNTCGDKLVTNLTHTCIASQGWTARRRAVQPWHAKQVYVGANCLVLSTF